MPFFSGDSYLERLLLGLFHHRVRERPDRHLKVLSAAAHPVLQARRSTRNCKVESAKETQGKMEMEGEIGALKGLRIG